MAAADEILGISGQMDISDIQASLDKLCDGLNRVGVDTEALSQRMNKALNDVAQSDEDLATKTTKAMQVLKSAMDEATKGIEVVPGMINTANKRVETIEGTISKLNERLAETEKGSDAFGTLTKQIDIQKQSLQLAKEDVTELSHSYENVRNVISEVNGAYNALNSFSVASTASNSVQTASNAAVGVSATAAATATTAEAAAHTANAAAALGNADAESQNAQATQQLTAALEEYMSVSSGRVEIERMQSESAKELKDDIKIYESAIKDIQSTIDSSDFSKKIEETTVKIEEQKNKIEQYKEAITKMSSNDNKTGNGENYYNKLIDSAQQKIDGLQAQIEKWEQEQQRLNADLKEYNTLLDAAKKIQAGENITKGYEKATKEAKKTAEETKDIGKSADDAAKKVGGIFSKIKGAFGSAIKGDLSGIFSIFGKLAGWGAVIGGIGKGLYELTKRAQEFKEALQPLSHYIDANKLEDVRHNILALSADTTKSVGDMAQSALQFVKVWDNLRDSPEALNTMVKSANEFGALSGKSSQESAKYLANLASEYHMTALEATEASNMIATAAHGSTSSFGEMADAISSAGSNASMYGISFKDMTTLIGYSSNQFGGAQKAASKFSMLLMNMEKMQNDKYKPSVVGMVTALQNMKVAMDKGELSEKAFNGRIRQTAKYFINNADAIAKYGKHIDSNKAKQELLADANKRAEVNVEKLQNAWNGLLTSLNANYTPILTNIFNFLNKIIGKAQKTADELRYINNFDRIHSKTRKEEKRQRKYTESVVSNTAGFSESQFILGAQSRMQLNPEDKIGDYRSQRNTLKATYRNLYKYYRNKYKKASGNAILNLTNNSMVKHYERKRGSYTEYDAQAFNAFLREQKESYAALNHKTNHADNGGNNNFTPTSNENKEKKAKQKAQQKAQEKLDEDLKRLQQKNNDETISLMQEGTEKKLAEIKNDYDKRKAEIDKQEAEFKKKNKEAGKEENLTSGQSDALNKARDLATQDYNKKLDEVNREALTSMRDYLKEYGSLYQQKQAITEEYEEKIAKAQSEGEKKTLQQQKKKALANFDYESISMGIDWKGLMSGVGNMSKEMLKPMLEKLDAYIKTEKFQQADTQTQQKVVDLMQEIRTYLGTDQNATWQNLAASITSFNQSVAEYQTAVKNEELWNAKIANAEKDLKNGNITQEAFNKIMKSSDDASQAVVDAKNKMNTFGIKLNSATEAVTNYTSGLTAALNKLGTWKGNEGFSEVQSSVGNIDALKGVLDESLSTMGNGVAKTMGATISKGLGNTLGSIGDEVNNMMGSALGSIVGVVAQIPKLILNLANSIKSFVTGILDSFTQLLQFEWLSGLVNSILDSVGNLIDAIFDLPENLFKALESIVVNGVGGLLDNVLGRVGNVLSFGALSSKGPSDWFTNSNAAKVNQRISKLTSSNERLDDSINRLRNTMDKTYGQQAKQAYEEAKRQQQQKNDNLKEIAKQKASYHSSHGSWNSYWKGIVSDETAAKYKRYFGSLGYLSKSEVAEISKILGRDFNGDIWSMNEDEINKMLGYDWFVERIRNTGAHYKGRSAYGESVLKAMQDWANSAGSIDELTDSFKENLTQISFDSMKDSFISNLMDMNKSAKDFADDFAEMMQKSVLSFSLDDLIYNEKDDGKDSIKKLYNDWAKAMNDNDGNLTDTIVNSFNERYDKLVEEGIKQRDEWAKITGYTGESSQSQQTATGKGIEAITADQASSLIGIGYAVQIAQEQGNEVRKAIAVDVSFLRIYAEQTYNNISEMRDIQYQGLEQLEAINKNTAPIILIREDIASMYKLMKERY